MTEDTSTPPEATQDETLALLNHSEVAALLRLTSKGFSNLLDNDGFPIKPAMTRGRAKFWRLSDIRRYLSPAEVAK